MIARVREVRRTVLGVPCGLQTCALCGGSAERVLGLTAYAPAGDSRIFGYSICENCWPNVLRNASVLEAVEKRIDDWRVAQLVFSPGGTA